MTSDRMPYWDADVTGLIDAWEASALSFAGVAAGLSADEWSMPSRVPGWSCADVVAHVASIEAELAGRPDPDHRPDYDKLAHATASATGPYTEIGVDLRRGRSQAEVVGELTELIGVRAEQWRSGTTDPDAPFTGPAGWALTVAKMLRMRCFDLWVHEQDIRSVVGRPGSETSPGAWVSAGQVAGALPAIWGRNVKAAEGQTWRVDVSGPESDSVSFTRVVGIGPDGRGIVLDDGLVPEPSVTLLGTWMALEPVVTGRADARDSEILITGDEDLATRLRAALNIAP